jgi:hypothetical protein
MTVTYTETGELYVTTIHDDGSQSQQDLGHLDVDGGDWVAPVDERLVAAGYRRVGDWDGDDAPVVEA